MDAQQMTRRQVREWLDLASDPDVFAVQEEVGMPSPDGYGAAEVDRLLAEVDRELAADARTEARRVNRKFSDERRARRAARRSEHAVVRALPVRLNTVSEVELDEEAA